MNFFLSTPPYLNYLTSSLCCLWAYYIKNDSLMLLEVQTDLMDLLGTDLPVESDEGMKFAWSDGILLQVYISTSKAFCIASSLENIFN